MLLQILLDCYHPSQIENVKQVFRQISPGLLCFFFSFFLFSLWCVWSLDTRFRVLLASRMNRAVRKAPGFDSIEYNRNQSSLVGMIWRFRSSIDFACSFADATTIVFIFYCFRPRVINDWDIVAFGWAWWCFMFSFGHYCSQRWWFCDP